MYILEVVDRQTGEFVTKREYTTVNECTAKCLLAEEWYLKFRRDYQLRILSDKGHLYGTVNTLRQLDDTLK